MELGRPRREILGCDCLTRADLDVPNPETPSCPRPRAACVLVSKEQPEAQTHV